MIVLETQRLVLRRWQSADVDLLVAMGLSPQVMRHYPALQTERESRDLAASLDAHIGLHGFGAFAVASRQTGEPLGVCGCKHLTWPHQLPSDIEVGWRFREEAWGKGYATEAAEASLRHCFALTGKDCIVSFTVQANRPSWSVMERLKMARRPDLDFDHPKVPEGHALKRHIVYVSRPSGAG